MAGIPFAAEVIYTLPENSGRGRRNSGRRRERCERCRKIPVVDGAIACSVAGIRFAAEVIHPLPENSGRGRRNSGRRRSNSGRWRGNSGPRRSRCERCRKIPVVDGAILCACAGIRFAAEVIYPLPENSGRGRRNSGRRRNDSGGWRDNSGRGRGDANAAGKFRSWTAPFGVRAPAFGSLPKLSTRCRKISVVDGAIQVIGGTIQESVERILLAVRPDRDAADKGEA